ncbi:UDP-N-acetylmuramate--alanine ligase [Clostridiales bacterium PH28_bin88]|nr:UDP-N-acetylmuramate--alanine ligase [Clostridiales bacterium PH28_bin88]
MVADHKEWTYFVGIGGAGMSGLAKILLELGHRVSGSDLKKSKVTERLAGMGATIFLGHAAHNLEPGVELVVVSSAIPKENPEVVEAKARGVPVIQRADLLARLMQRQRAIAIAGAHGKTTTTSMISLMLDKNGMDPTVVIGGELNDIGGNAKLGHGRYLVAEADESDKSFLKLFPFVAVVTNIENDHLDNYGSVANIIAAFEEFIHKVPEEGFVVLCSDDPELYRISQDGRKKYITYGLEGQTDYTAREIHLEGLTSRSEIFFRGARLGQLSLNVPGKHNVLNALAAIAVGHQLGISFEGIAASLAGFQGVERRFQIIGKAAGVRVVDDYGHHPTEIQATLRAARCTHPSRLVVVFQPHRYTRTQLLHEQFGPAFAHADITVIDAIYGAGEPPIPGVTAELIANAARTYCPQVYFMPGANAIMDYLIANCRPGDLVITMGAGNIWEIGREFLKRLEMQDTGEAPVKYRTSNLGQ